MSWTQVFFMLIGFAILANVFLFPILKSERSRRNNTNVEVKAVELVESKV
jgi:hypothetical protein